MGGWAWSPCSVFFLLNKECLQSYLQLEKSGVIKNKEHLDRPASSRNGDSVATVQMVVPSDWYVMI